MQRALPDGQKERLTLICNGIASVMLTQHAINPNREGGGAYAWSLSRKGKRYNMSVFNKAVLCYQKADSGQPLILPIYTRSYFSFQ